MSDEPDPRLHFADHLRLLFATAGGPPLKTVVSEASALARALGSDKPVSIQRLSDWRSGKRVPATFDAVRPVLVVLIRAAQALHGSRPPSPGLYSLKRWQGWWSAAREGAGAVRDRPDAPTPVPKPLTGVRPYRGLEPYRTEDAHLFFGRSRSIERLVAVVTAAQGRGIAIVTGASGVGKSSLVQAGLVTELLRGESSAPEPTAASIVLTPGPDPLGALAEAVPELGAPEPDQESVQRAVDAAAQRLGVAHLVLVVDQLEELFTQCADAADGD
ncbi:ATP-binding protein, partial [Bacillus safensis]|uniref:ATP-binding protein n=1 Tax=Bacillus safensis TaxID=561879 RepID=UPI003650550A